MDAQELRSAFEAQLSLLTGSAKNAFSYLRCRATFDDAVATSVAFAWEQWTRENADGKDPRQNGGLIAKWSILAAARGRAFTRYRYQSDVLSPRARCRHGFHLVYGSAASNRFKRSLLDSLESTRSTRPERLAAARLDWDGFTAGMLPFTRRIARMMGEGLDNKRIARILRTDQNRMKGIRERVAREWAQYCQG